MSFGGIFRQEFGRTLYFAGHPFKGKSLQNWFFFLTEISSFLLAVESLLLRVGFRNRPPHTRYLVRVELFWDWVWRNLFLTIHFVDQISQSDELNWFHEWSEGGLVRQQARVHDWSWIGTVHSIVAQAFWKRMEEKGFVRWMLQFGVDLGPIVLFFGAIEGSTVLKVDVLNSKPNSKLLPVGFGQLWLWIAPNCNMLARRLAQSCCFWAIVFIFIEDPAVSWELLAPFPIFSTAPFIPWRSFGQQIPRCSQAIGFGSKTTRLPPVTGAICLRINSPSTNLAPCKCIDHTIG